VDPTHEELAAQRAGARWPDRYVSASHEVAPEFREYERLSTTILNAYLGPLVARYASRFREGTRALGIPCEPYVTQSNGGIISVDGAAQSPARTLLSGPSAGVMGAAAILAYEHSLVRPGDLSRLDAAFFTMNGIMSVSVFLFALVDRLAG